MDVLEKYNYDLGRYADHEWNYVLLYQYESIIQDEVIIAKETAEQVWDNLTI
jgi:hypothetical protein